MMGKHLGYLNFDLYGMYRVFRLYYSFIPPFEFFKGRY